MTRFIGGEDDKNQVNKPNVLVSAFCLFFTFLVSLYCTMTFYEFVADKNFGHYAYVGYITMLLHTMGSISKLKIAGSENRISQNVKLWSVIISALIVLLLRQLSGLLK
ncbi:unnamed protein product [Acanthoscelides obtectus]|nr:unnamed protein product [Acanthoscelides obtectus]CAK1630717.1 hypothetical protein AOBTE_LOCUS6516 [Acanthoscelides obtectus]